LSKSKDKFNHVSIVEKAISSSQGIVNLYDYANESASGHASLDSKIFESLHNISSPSCFKVESTSLDHELKDFEGLKRVCLFKFDIEGHEL
jgi:hypothetical protein